LPVLKMLSTSRDEIGLRVRSLLDELSITSGDDGLKIEVVDGNSAVGGGAAPTVQPATVLLAISHKDRSAETLERQLRMSSPPVITRIVGDQVCVDLRTVSPEDEDDLLSALLQLSPGMKAAERES